MAICQRCASSYREPEDNSDQHLCPKCEHFLRTGRRYYGKVIRYDEETRTGMVEVYEMLYTFAVLPSILPGLRSIRETDMIELAKVEKQSSLKYYFTYLGHY